MKKLISLVLFVLVISTGCANDVKKNEQPEWINNPGSNFVGKCGTHVRGSIAQEQCAYKKGLTYMAMSKGVSVDVSSNIKMKQTADQKTGSSYGKVEAVVKMDEKDIRVSGSIIDKYHDKVADIMYVLIKEN